ncbi:hypothetical protein QBC38DRAFT_158636 [Podospora fimiseda]|uniref:Glycine zipper 2TM domain-containing protein n=1 Tax=Podospora fimiseda TaxID=252190 RepID=A0AAN7H5H2_9PEZI|nr:hypothetical protein QBC38DRAFT_158636 [Podospora fimiseda]
MPRPYPDSDSDSNFPSRRSRSQTPGPPRHRPRDYSPSPDRGPPYSSGALRHPHFEQHTPFYAPEQRSPQPLPSNTLAPPRSRSRRTDSDDYLPTSTLTTTTRGRIRRSSSTSSTSSTSSSSSSKKRGVSERRRIGDGPINKAKSALEKTFTPSTSGLGVGVLGAIVGGLVAGEVGHRVQKKHNSTKHGDDHYEYDEYGNGSKKKDDKGAVLISTIVGAAVGGLGANAVERRLERGKGREEELRELRGKRKDLEKRVGKEERDLKEGRY